MFESERSVYIMFYFYVVLIHLFVIYVVIFVRCVAVRCLSEALVGGGDKPPCATGRLRNRAVIIA
jgi:hypothetical protein